MDLERARETGMVLFPLFVFCSIWKPPMHAMPRGHVCGFWVDTRNGHVFELKIVFLLLRQVARPSNETAQMATQNPTWCIIREPRACFFFSSSFFGKTHFRRAPCAVPLAQARSLSFSPKAANPPPPPQQPTSSIHHPPSSPCRPHHPQFSTIPLYAIPPPHYQYPTSTLRPLPQPPPPRHHHRHPPQSPPSFTYPERSGENPSPQSSVPPPAT